MRSGVKVATVLALVLGAVLRTVQYGANASLDRDEVSIVVNVVERGWSDLLFQPLKHNQVAPVGFLFLEKTSLTIGGNTEAAFRFFPYLLSLLSLLLFWRLSRRYLRPPALLAAVIVFALSPTLILYAGFVKQYTGDVATTLLLLWMTLRFLDTPTTAAQAAVIGIAGGAAILISHPAVLVASGLAIAVLVRGRRGGKPVSQLLIICIGWFLSTAIMTWISLSTLSPSTGEYMRDFWGDGFVPPPWMGVRELLWIPYRLGTMTTFFATSLHPPLQAWRQIAVTGFYTLLLPLGFLYLCKRDVRAAVLLAVPVIVAIAAATVGILPLAGRITLYLAPSLFVCSIAGLDRVRAWLPRRSANASYAVGLALAVLPTLAGLARTPPPVVQWGTLPALREVKTRWLPGDRLVAARGQWTSMLVEYYGSRLGLDQRTHLDRLQGDHTDEEILRAYLRRIDAFRGDPRVWFHLEQTIACEDEAILGYLDAIGRRLYSAESHLRPTTLRGAHRISTHLYDLSDRRLLGRTNAERYAVPKCEMLG
jgi:hypothetical protein